MTTNRMSEIEKLYRNAGVESVGFNTYKLEDEYPQFTAEKQLELIKWCLDNYRGEIFDTIETTEWFEEQLCAYINNEWQDLAEKEREEIKNILEQ